ncbi:MAG: metallophosphoesterase family protein [Bosea sp. (in: a-proteobacteria)]
MFTLAHLSDPHLSPVPFVSWRALMNKRLTGYLNWRYRRSHIHDMAVLDKVLNDIAAQNPSHIAMTGDLGHIGLGQEFEAAKAFMTRLGSPDHVSFVPGNHDAYAAGALDQCLARFGAHTTSDDGAPGFPYLRLRGPVALIGMSSAVPTLPFLATGQLGQDQIDRAEALLRYAGSLGLTRIIMVHHAPHEGGAKILRRLDDAASFEAMLARAGAELVIHGHNHRTSLAHRPGPARPVPILGVASASGADDGRHEPAAWHLIRIDPAASEPIQVEHRRMVGESIEVTRIDLKTGLRV